MISGAPVDEFRGGWALMPMIGSRQHLWRFDIEWRDETQGMVRGLTSECGIDAVSYRRVPALQGGDWPKCKRCELKEA